MIFIIFGPEYAWLGGTIIVYLEDGRKFIMEVEDKYDSISLINACELAPDFKEIKLESKKVEENVKIEVSDDGTEVEVRTDEGENVEVVDETEEPKTSDEEATEENEEDLDESKKCENRKKLNNFNKKSFEEALTKFYKFNSDKVESFNLKGIAQNKKGDLKIEGKLNNKVPVTMIFNKKVEGKLFNKYTLASTNNILKESKDITTNLMLTKNNKTFECRYIISK